MTKQEYYIDDEAGLRIRLPKPKNKKVEHTTQSAIQKFAVLKGYVCIRFNSGQTAMDGRMFRSYTIANNGMSAGLADLLLINKQGLHIWVEVKTDKGRQTPAQKQYEQLITKQGGLYFVVRSFAEGQELIERFHKYGGNNGNN